MPVIPPCHDCLGHGHRRWQAPSESGMGGATGKTLRLFDELAPPGYPNKKGLAIMAIDTAADIWN